MVCRVKVRVRVKDKVVENRALVNSGFEADAPDIVIPTNIARQLNLWPPRTNITAILDTGGGEVVNPYYENCGILELILDDRENIRIKVNIIVNPHIDEIALSDYVSSLLGIVLLDIKKGLWKLKDDPTEKVRT